MDDGGGGGVVEQFYYNKSISAVTDDGFGQEDEDYEDLYNDVNVGDGFLNSFRKNEDLGFKNQKESLGKPPVVSSRGAGQGYWERNDVSMKGQVRVVLNGGVGPGEGAGVSSVGRGYGGGLRVELGHNRTSKIGDVEEKMDNNLAGEEISRPQPPHVVSGQEGMSRNGGGVVNRIGGNVGGTGSSVMQATPGGARGGGNGTILFVGDLHWWTIDAELESELVKYGPSKEVKFFDEKSEWEVERVMSS